MRETIIHPLKPLYNSASRVLILGTMPSPKSREEGFYYAHPRNMFWPIMGRILEEELPPDREGKCRMLLHRRIALWDVVHACTISGADDNSIGDVEPNDIGFLLDKTEISVIFTTGKKATALYQRYCEEKTGIKPRYLPSTSPANCRFFTFLDMVLAYRAILPYCDGKDFAALGDI